MVLLTEKEGQEVNKVCLISANSVKDTRSQTFIFGAQLKKKDKTRIRRRMMSGMRRQVRQW